jgi:hypothetical protein
MRSSRSRSEEEEEEEDLADLRERCEALTFLVLGEDLAKAAEWRSGFGRVYALERRLADETTDESVRALARDLDETEAAIEAALAAALEIPSTGERPREGDGPPGLWQGTVDRPRCPRPSWSKAILTHHADENYYRALGAADEDGDDDESEAGDLVGPPVDEAVGFRRPSAPPVASVGAPVASSTTEGAQLTLSISSDDPSGHSTPTQRLRSRSQTRARPVFEVSP